MNSIRALKAALILYLMALTSLFLTGCADGVSAGAGAALTVTDVVNPASGNRVYPSSEKSALPNATDGSTKDVKKTKNSSKPNILN